MSETVTVSDVCGEVVDCDHRTAPAARPGTEYGYSIGTRDIRNGRIVLDKAKRVNQETFKAWTARELPRAGDIILTREAPVGQAGLLDGAHVVCLGQRTTLLRPDPTKVRSRFLHYLLLSPVVQQQMLNRSSGSIVDHLNVEDIRNLELGVLPDLYVQQAIAEVLGALDDKIALNERLTRTADRLIRAHHSSSALLCDQKIELESLGYAIRETISADRLTGSEKYAGLEHIPRRLMWLTEWRVAEGVVSAKSQFLQHDILFGRLRPYFHKVSLALVDGVCSTDILVVRPRKPNFLGWLFASMSSDEVVAHASAVGDGTRMPRVKWPDLASYAVPWPGEEEASRFNGLVTSLAGRVASAVMESNRLSELRDALLPKLMSGEIRVRHAEKAIEEAL